MNKINSLQLFAILLLSGAWMLVCTPVLFGPGQIIGAAVVCGIEILLCIPMLMTDFEAIVGRQKWLGIVYSVYFLLVGAMGFTQVYAAAPKQLFESPGQVTAAILIILTCLYTSTSGLKATARCAPLALGFLLITTVVLLVGAWQRADLNRLNFRSEGFVQGGLSYFSLSGELAAAWVLLGRVKDGGRRAVNGYLLAKAGFGILLLTLCITAGSRLTKAQDYPFLTLISLSQPLQGQRADALYILAFVMLHVFHMTLMTGVTAHILGMVHPKLKESAPFALIVMLLLAVLIPEQAAAGTVAVTMPVLAGGVPLTAWILSRVRRRAAA